MATVEIDPHSGFCSGVVKAIRKAETFLDGERTLYSLGDIVHNNSEVERLEDRGMRTITGEELKDLRNVDVLFRAHGEPPATYELAKQNNIRLIDATCPVVLSLQDRIRRKYREHASDGTQIVLFGKKGHAEVVGLLGQTDNTALVLEKVSDAEKLDFSRPIALFSQTTKSLEEFQELVAFIQASMKEGVPFEYRDTICRQVANRLPHIREFAGQYDGILFVSGAKSSNGKALFDACLSVNKNSYFVTGPGDVNYRMLEGFDRIGICGATSTPVWLMEEVKKQAEMLLSAV